MALKSTPIKNVHATPVLRLRLCLTAISTVFCLLIVRVGRCQEGSPDSAKVRADLKRILADPQFQPPSSGENWGDRLFKWIGDEWNAFWRWFRKLFSFPEMHVQSSGKLGSYLSIVFSTLFVALAIALAAWLISRLVILYRSKERVKSPAKSSAFDLDEDEAPLFVTEPDVWFSQAEKYAAGSDYRRAFRALFLAALLHLDRIGILEFAKSRTNGDYLRQLRNGKHTTAFTLMTEFSLEFEKHWYGNKACGKLQYAAASKTYSEVRRIHSVPERLTQQLGPQLLEAAPRI